MDIHPWWQSFGEAVPEGTALPPRAAALIDALRTGIAGARLTEVKRCPATKIAAVNLEIDVERPQRLAHAITGTERVAILDVEGDAQPSVLALRSDFPADIPHQNDVPEGTPCALCIDDRPWAEAKLTWTALDTVRRIQLWLAKAARGELHDAARPLDPIFFRSPVSLVVPRTALEPGSPGKELVGFIHDDARLVIARPLSSLGGFVPDKGRMLVLAFRVSEQKMRRLRQAPMTLARLAEEMQHCGSNLVEELQRHTGQLAALGGERVRQLHSTMAIIVTFPVTNEGGPAVDDRRAFITKQTAGEIGIALGSLLPATTGSGPAKGYVKAIGGTHKASLSGLDIQPAELHLAIDRTLAAAAAGKPADTRKAVLVGAGSLGSQLALNLAREGCFAWTVIDDDHLLPHNLARHGLLPESVGMAKATALADNLAGLLGEAAPAIVTDITTPDASHKDAVDRAIAEADVVIDATASVAAARHLSDLPATARRVSVFFNPSGTAVVILAEPKDRSVTLRDLEAQYHRAIMQVPGLAGHLTVEQKALRYSGSCRALTNRIPATQAAILSGLAAAGIHSAMDADNGSIRIYTLSSAGEVACITRVASAVTRKELGAWTLIYDAALLDDLSAMRARHLPRETGGVLLGIVDMSRRSIHLVAGLPPPADSVGSVQGFERGVAELAETVNRATEASLHQIRYVGEWHSHPPRASRMPSMIDLAQVAWLRRELAQEGLPAVMAIAADRCQFTFVLADAADAGGDER
jgi:hypothetical protein